MSEDTKRGSPPPKQEPSPYLSGGNSVNQCAFKSQTAKKNHNFRVGHQILIQITVHHYSQVILMCEVQKESNMFPCHRLAIVHRLIVWML